MSLSNPVGVNRALRRVTMASLMAEVSRFCMFRESEIDETKGYWLEEKKYSYIAEYDGP